MALTLNRWTSLPWAAVALSMFGATACGTSNPPPITGDSSVHDADPSDGPSASDTAADSAPSDGICRDYEPAEALGEVMNPEITECSGLIASRENLGVYWLHNDSGDQPRIFAIDERGRSLAEVVVLDAVHDDWEDLSLITGPGNDRLVIGDIGDNPMRRSSITLYLVEEPELSLSVESPLRLDATAETIRLTYPGGASYNAESLTVDPVSGNLYILTKDDLGESRLFVDRDPWRSSPEPHPLEEVARLRINSEGVISTHATGMDISPSGDRVLVRTYFELIQWARPPGTTVEEAMRSPRLVLPSPPERQGEAVCFNAAGDAFLTISEGGNPAVFRVETSSSCVPTDPASSS